MMRSVTASPFYPRKPLPKRFCNLDRLLHALEARGLDGIVVTLPNNVFYLSGFNGIAHKSDEPRVCAVLLSRHAPEHPVMVIADYYLATFLTQPTWIEDIRPFRAVARPSGTEIRHQPFHPAGRQRQAVGRECAQAIRLRYGQRAQVGIARAEARTCKGCLRRSGLRPEAAHGWSCRCRWL